MEKLKKRPSKSFMNKRDKSFDRKKFKDRKRRSRFESMKEKYSILCKVLIDCQI